MQAKLGPSWVATGHHSRFTTNGTCREIAKGHGQEQQSLRYLLEVPPVALQQIEMGCTLNTPSGEMGETGAHWKHTRFRCGKRFGTGLGGGKQPRRPTTESLELGWAQGGARVCGRRWPGGRVLQWAPEAMSCCCRSYKGRGQRVGWGRQLRPDPRPLA